MRGKKKSKDAENGDEDETQPEENVERTRDELLEKIQKLKSADDEFYDGVGEDDESWDSEDFSSGEE